MLYSIQIIHWISIKNHRQIQQIPKMKVRVFKYQYKPTLSFRVFLEQLLAIKKFEEEGIPSETNPYRCIISRHFI